MTQFALFTEAPRRTTTPTPGMVRERLEAVLAELKAADVMPWTADEARQWTVAVPQMCKWLPDEEAARWRAEFDAEMARFEKTQAA